MEAGIAVGVRDEVEDSGMEDWDETVRHEISVPLVTVKMLDDWVPADA